MLDGEAAAVHAPAGSAAAAEIVVATTAGAAGDSTLTQSADTALPGAAENGAVAQIDGETVESDGAGTAVAHIAGLPGEAGEAGNAPCTVCLGVLQSLDGELPLSSDEVLPCTDTRHQALLDLLHKRFEMTLARC